MLRFLRGPGVSGLRQDEGRWRRLRGGQSSQETEPWWMATANAVLDAYHVQGTVCVRPHSILATARSHR